MTPDISSTALIVIDVQRAFDQWEAAGKRRNNPDAVARIVDLLAAFRRRARAHRDGVGGRGGAPNPPALARIDAITQAARVAAGEVHHAGLGRELAVKI
jgi:hypothetical protein